MNIVVALKVVPDDQDIQVSAAGDLDMSKAHQVISAYDLNAIEAAAQLAASVGDSPVYALTVGPSQIDDSKLKKNILARGADELFMVADDAYADMDAFNTAAALAAELEAIGSYDIVICGDGSADNYAQQVDVQLGCKLGIPSVNSVVGLECSGSTVVAKRKLEDTIQTVELPLPCIVAVTPDVALPRIPGMRDILAAGKKPMKVDGAQAQVSPKITTVEVKAPEAAERAQDVKDASEDGAIDAFAAALKAALE